MGINIKSTELRTGGKDKKVEMEKEREGVEFEFLVSYFLTHQAFRETR